MKQGVVAILASLATAFLLYLVGAFDSKNEEYFRAKVVEDLTNDAAFIRTIREKLNDDNSFSNFVASELKDDIVKNLFPDGIVLALNASECPRGWKDFQPAYGKFLRGIDPSGQYDTQNRPPSDLQDDSFQGHGHQFFEEAQSTAHAGPGNAPHHYSSGQYGHGVSIADKIIGSQGFGEPKVSDETRPKNVAVLFCTKESN